jgi:hypothetical protein
VGRGIDHKVRNVGTSEHREVLVELKGPSHSVEAQKPETNEERAGRPPPREADASTSTRARGSRPGRGRAECSIRARRGGAPDRTPNGRRSSR